VGGKRLHSDAPGRILGFQFSRRRKKSRRFRGPVVPAGGRLGHGSNQVGLKETIANCSTLECEINAKRCPFVWEGKAYRKQTGILSVHFEMHGQFEVDLFLFPRLAGKVSFQTSPNAKTG